MGVSERLRQLIELKYRSLKEFSEAMDMPYRTVQQYLGGHRLPGYEGLERIVSRSNVEPYWLLTGKGPMFRDEGGASAAQSAPVIPIEDMPKERMKAWLDAFWMQASSNERIWLEVQIERNFPEYREWLKKNEGERSRKTG